MARTFNRRPLSVNTPSSSDLKEHFFNHYNWKGMNANKNFLAADQETFEECNNVYMNAEGILRSRPALKQTGETGIVKFWNFQNTKVYLLKDSEEYRLDFHDGINHCYLDVVNDNINLIQKDNKIFIFADGIDFKYYDGTIKPATDYVYVPTTASVSNGVKEAVESKNLLTSNETTSYLYSLELNRPFLPADTDVEVILSDGSYEIPYEYDTFPQLVREPKFSLPNDTNYLIGSSSLGTDVYVACELKETEDYILLKNIYTKIGKQNWIKREMSQVDIPNSTCYIPKGPLEQSLLGISDDGSTFYISLSSVTIGGTQVQSQGLYCLSIIKNENNEYRYELLVRRSSPYTYHINSSNNRVRVITPDNIIRCYNMDNKVYVKYETYDLYVDISASIKAACIDLLNPDFNIYLLTSDDSNRLKLYTLRWIVDGNTRRLELTNESESTVNNNVILGTLRLNQLIYADANAVQLYDFSSKTNTVIVDVSFNNDYLSFYTSRFYSDDEQVFLPFGVFFIEYNQFRSYLFPEDVSKAMIHRVDLYNYYSFYNDTLIYGNDVKNPIKIKAKSGGNINSSFVSELSKSSFNELDNYYFAVDSFVYITESRANETGDFLWYFPEINKTTFPSKITALQPISGTEMAVFLEDEIHYVSKQEGLYYSYKSKLKSGLRDGSDVITSYDGTNVIFPTERGLVALSYQNFVASTDQTLTYLSDAISEQFKEFVKHPVKLLRYQFWILAYSPELTTAYLLDLRNNSWWPMTYRSLPIEFYVVDNEVLLLSENKLFKLDKSDEDYYDYDGTKHQINWNFKSQKLHLNAVNYYKHISNLTLYSVLDTDKEMNFVMDVNNYRKQTDTTEIQTISYKVDTIRTFVKRVSYPKVNEFQYSVHQDDEREIRLPLSLSGITIKYKISGQVR